MTKQRQDVPAAFATSMYLRKQNYKNAWSKIKPHHCTTSQQDDEYEDDNLSNDWHISVH